MSQKVNFGDRARFEPLNTLDRWLWEKFPKKFYQPYIERTEEGADTPTPVYQYKFGSRGPILDPTVPNHSTLQMQPFPVDPGTLVDGGEHRPAIIPKGTRIDDFRNLALPLEISCNIKTFMVNIEVSNPRAEIKVREEIPAVVEYDDEAGFSGEVLQQPDIKNEDYPNGEYRDTRVPVIKRAARYRTAGGLDVFAEQDRYTFSEYPEEGEESGGGGRNEKVAIGYVAAAVNIGGKIVGSTIAGRVNLLPVLSISVASSFVGNGGKLYLSTIRCDSYPSEMLSLADRRYVETRGAVKELGNVTICGCPCVGIDRRDWTGEEDTDSDIRIDISAAEFYNSTDRWARTIEESSLMDLV